jgi:hypothetical protein
MVQLTEPTDHFTTELNMYVLRVMMALAFKTPYLAADNDGAK